MQKNLQNDSRYSWTAHVEEKMRYYGISPGRVKRIIRFPARSEEGVASNTIAVMQSAGTKRYQEIWVMYKIEKPKKETESKIINFNLQKGKIKIITAWRYPGKSPARDPIPSEVIKEIQNLL